jgi:hypothetical protein
VDLPPDRVWRVILSNILGAYLGARLPDILDPPTSPNHRHVAHGAVNATVAGYFCLNSLGEWQRSLHTRADELNWSRQFLPDEETRSNSAVAELLLLASAAYRSASRLYDERLDRRHDFTSKTGVVHSEVMTPDDAPKEFRERERLWNAVEAAEKRKDAQLARDFVEREFVARGMVAEFEHPLGYRSARPTQASCSRHAHHAER